MGLEGLNRLLILLLKDFEQLVPSADLPLLWPILAYVELGLAPSPVSENHCLYNIG